MKKADILGIRLKDCSLREEMKAANEYLRDGALNTIIYLSNEILVEAGENPVQKEWIESMDMTVFGDTDILRASGIESRSRLREVENDEFFKEFLKRLVHEQKTVFLIAETEEALEKLQERILAERDSLKIAGTYLINEDNADQDLVVNEINDVAPGVVISCLPFAVQAQYMHDYHKMVNADIWLGLLPEQNGNGIRQSVWNTLYKKYMGRLFRKRVTRYEQGQSHEK